MVAQKGILERERQSRYAWGGPNGDRVKAIKLRGELSQGILYSVDSYPEYDPETDFVLTVSYPKTTSEIDWEVGMDVSELLGITKWEQKIPDSFSGEAGFVGRDNFPQFDIENLKKFPNLFSEDIEVICEEKIHGTFVVFGKIPGLDSDNAIDREYVVTSKGFTGKGITLLDTPSNQKSNLYIKAFHHLGMKEKLDITSEFFVGQSVYILGEIFGEGIQDLGYSSPSGSFRAFSVFVGDPKDGTWLSADAKYYLLESLGLDHPEILYRGPFNKEKILDITSGTSTIDNKTIREGVVITPVVEFKDRQGRRAILKSVSPEYLLRKGNVTKFQ